MNISGSVSFTLVIDESLPVGLDSGATELSETVTQNFTAGTAAGQCDLRWSRSSTLAAGASDTWTLSALTDGLGRAVAFARLNIVEITNPATVAGDDLTVGGAATHPVTSLPTYTVHSMGFDVKAGLNTAGYATPAGSADQLKVLNSGANPITYRIALAGRSV